MVAALQLGDTFKMYASPLLSGFSLNGAESCDCTALCDAAISFRIVRIE